MSTRTPLTLKNFSKTYFLKTCVSVAVHVHKIFGKVFEKLGENAYTGKMLYHGKVLPFYLFTMLKYYHFTTLSY